MPYKQSFKLMLVGISLLLLTACASTPDDGEAGGKTDESASGASSEAVSTGAGDIGNYDSSGDRALQVGNQSYYFALNKSDISSADMPSIKVQAGYLVAHPSARVRLEGNTDPRGSREYNIGLGERRAAALQQQLMAQGVSKTQLTTISYGAQKALSLPQDEETYAKERRVDLVYETDIQQSAKK